MRETEMMPVRYPFGTHPINNEKLDYRALKILQTLTGAGYSAYLVGGCIRDLLLGKTPKDFDIATDARPQQIKSLFRNCRLIGRRFRLAHIYFGNEIIEVATFRAPPEKAALTDRFGSVLDDNHYGTIEDDVIRRDFSINALYYDAATGEIIDYIGALDDIREQILCVIGDPVARYTEDPVRMLRAARFSAKLNMPLEEQTKAAIIKCRENLRAVPPARLFDECQKLFLGGYGVKCFEKLSYFDLFAMLFPDTARIFNHPNQNYASYARHLITFALQNTDQRVAEGRPVTIGFVFAAMLWSVYQLQYQGLLQEAENWYEAMKKAADIVLIAASDRVSIPMRFRALISEIWLLQARLEQTANSQSSRKMHNLLSHPRFHAAYDFLLLREGAGEDVSELINIWTQLQAQEIRPRKITRDPYDDPLPEPKKSKYIPSNQRRGRRKR